MIFPTLQSLPPFYTEEREEVDLADLEALGKVAIELGISSNSVIKHSFQHLVNLVGCPSFMRDLPVLQGLLLRIRAWMISRELLVDSSNSHLSSSNAQRLASEEEDRLFQEFFSKEAQHHHAKIAPAKGNKLFHYDYFDASAQQQGSDSLKKDESMLRFSTSSKRQRKTAGAAEIDKIATELLHLESSSTSPHSNATSNQVEEEKSNFYWSYEGLLAPQSQQDEFDFSAYLDLHQSTENSIILS